MKKNKFLTSAVIGVSMLAGLQSSPAHAIVAMVIGNVPILLGGLVVGFGGHFVACEALIKSADPDASCGIFSEGYGWSGMEEPKNIQISEALGETSMVIGGLMLDDSSGKVEFTQLTEEQASSMGISEGDRVSYNSSLDELNAVAATVAQETNEFSQTGATQKQVFTMSTQLWQQNQTSLDQGAVRTAAVIAQKTLQSN